MKKLTNIDDSAIHYGIYARFVKRPLDCAVAACGLAVLSPVLLALSLLVRIKLGKPVLFRQTRCGRDERPFEMIKFRTMTDARDSDGHLLPDIERFTKFGDFLRNYSLDELPELLNVVKGDMSIIGPRPLYTFYVPYYTEEEALRHAVRGGITGLAQVNGRALCKWNDRFCYDVDYVKDITFLNDIKILWKTVAKVFGKSDIGIPSVTDEGGLHIVREVQRASKVTEIGSSFEALSTSYDCDDYPPSLPRHRLEHTVYLSTARSCIREVLVHLEATRKCAIVPEFTCQSVLDPFVDAGYEVFPYQVNSDLTIDLDALTTLIESERPSVMLFHRYFGFNTCDGIEDVMDKHGEIVLIEDETQCMFSNGWNSSADFRIGSIRKWGPLPDGAYLTSSQEVIQQPTMQDEELVRIQTGAMEAKRRYLSGLNPSQDYLSLFAYGREYVDQQTEVFSISKHSCQLISSMETAEISKIRRDNAKVLMDGLRGFLWFECVFQNTQDGVTPFMVPILVHERREEFQRYLATQKIYATVIWGCPKEIRARISTNGMKVYDEILCLPCDQRYTTEDMRRVVSSITHYDRFLRSKK